MPASPKKHQTHTMETRSKTFINTNEDNYNDNNNDNDNDNDNDNEIIDEYGNIKGFIDYNETLEDFNHELFNKEIKNLKRPSKKRKLNSNNYSEMLLNLILNDANKEINNINFDEKYVNNDDNYSDSDSEYTNNESSSDSDSDSDSDSILSDISENEVNDIIESANRYVNKNSKHKKILNPNKEIDIEYSDNEDSDNEDSDSDEIPDKNIDPSDIFGNIIKEIIREKSDVIDEEEMSKLDELDIKYKEYNKEELYIDDMNLKYFMNLTKEKKINILDEINLIQNINNNNTPLEFKVLESNMDINTKSIAISHINKIKDLDTSTTEYSKLEQWIMGLIKIPFSRYINLPINNLSSIEEKRVYLKNTNKILDKAIYGHNNAKSHILQLISKWIKNPMSGGNILAIQGPMGNGKTTLVKEGIAKAINRPFAFIALGGASDSSFFDGHNYTYEGSRWGRIIDILIQSNCMNPVIYFDELDKVSDTNKGQEIIHLLTHLTDHSQNNQFQDNYFSGINIDLSKILFIFSFNDESKVDRILKDRMYVINTKGFKKEEKLKIANNYLLPELLDNFKYNDNIIINDNIIEEIIDNYTNEEEGVRNLKRCIETIISKVNMYELLYDENDEDIGIDLPYKIKDFSIPYTVSKEVLPFLLSKSEIDFYKPPEHMYT